MNPTSKFQKKDFVSVVIFGETLFVGEVTNIRFQNGRDPLYTIVNPATHKHFTEYERHLKGANDSN